MEDDLASSLQLQVVAEHDGGWLVHVSSPGRQPVTERLPAAQAQAIVEHCRRALAPQTLSVMGQVMRRQLAELDVGRRLSVVLTRGRVAAEVQRARATVDRDGGLTVIAVATGGAADDPAQRQVDALPWELLSWADDEVPVEGASGAVVRLGAGRGGPVAPAEALRVVLWGVTPQDPLCATQADEIERLCRELQIEVIRLPPHGGDLPQSRPDRVDVLHIVCHGDRLQDHGLLRLAEHHALPAGAAVGLVGEGLRQISAVVLDVCGGGHPGRLRVESLTGALLASGAPAVVSPVQALDVEASRAFAAGLYEGLTRGARWVGAVRAGRARVSALAHPHPEYRPSNLVFTVAHVEIATGPAPVGRTWRPAGWRLGGHSVRAALYQARQRADALRSPFVGLEHLLPSLPRDALPAWWAARLPEADHAVWATLRADLVAAPDAAPAPVGVSALSPRLSRIGHLEFDGDGLAPLLQALVAEAAGPLVALMGPLAWARPGSGWEDTHTAGGLSTPRAATGLELVFGPEDGRLIWPCPGQVIGCARPVDGPDIGIYEGAAQRDARLHRKQLRYEGLGRWWSLYPTRLVRAGAAHDAPTPLPAGELDLNVGDLLMLTNATWVRGVEPAGSGQHT